MFYVVILLLLAIWMHRNFAHDTSKRYFLPMAGDEPAGCLGPAGMFPANCCAGQRLALGFDRQTRAVWVPLLAFAVSLGNVGRSDYRQRGVTANFGHGYSQTELALRRPCSGRAV